MNEKLSGFFSCVSMISSTEGEELEKTFLDALQKDPDMKELYQEHLMLIASDENYHRAFLEYVEVCKKGNQGLESLFNKLASADENTSFVKVLAWDIAYDIKLYIHKKKIDATKHGLAQWYPLSP